MSSFVHPLWIETWYDLVSNRLHVAVTHGKAKEVFELDGRVTADEILNAALPVKNRMFREEQKALKVIERLEQ